MRYQIIIILIAGACLALCTSCTDVSEPVAPVVEENTTPAKSTQSVVAPEEQPEEIVEEEKVSEEEESEAATAESPAKTTFQPPFPDRTDLFQAPRRQRTSIAKSKGEAERSVELLGFVNVDEQRVLLSIDGLVAPVAEGGVHAGIEVISIQPPKVVLQRGRQRWQAAFHN